jgi:1,4-alpha-glucan branching enzyme
MWTTPGKKLLFMGGEFGQWREWNHDSSLDWHLLGDERHAGLQRWVGDLNRLYREHPAMHVRDNEPEGFEWVDANDSEASVLTYLRWGRSGEVVLVACNFTPLVRPHYMVGVPFGGAWREVLNSDAEPYGGGGIGNLGRVESPPFGAHGRPRALNLTLPPLSCVVLTPEDG